MPFWCVRLDQIAHKGHQRIGGSPWQMKDLPRLQVMRQRPQVVVLMNQIDTVFIAIVALGDRFAAIPSFDDIILKQRIGQCWAAKAKQEQQAKPKLTDHRPRLIKRHSLRQMASSPTIFKATSLAPARISAGVASEALTSTIKTGNRCTAAFLRI